MSPTPSLPQLALRLDRRKFVALSGSLLAAGVLPGSALALAEPVRFTAGDYDVAVIDDGALLFLLAIVTPDAPADAVTALLGAQVGRHGPLSVEPAAAPGAG